MRVVLCAFMLGVVVLQQQAALPTRVEWGGGALVCLALGALAFMRGRTGCDAQTVGGWRRAGVLGLAALAAALTGFGYAAWRAELRLREVLPTAWEGRDIDVTGHVRGLPVLEKRGVRMQFAVDVESARRATGLDRFPSTLQLSWIDRFGRGAPELVPGDRWRLTVRLKRPHGYANFAGADAEAAWLARGVRATGYVASPARARRLPGTAGGLITTIDRWRFALRTRMGEVLTNAPHRGIVMALAIGAQDAIDEMERVVLRRTGTSHLVAISGLHIGFVAGWIAVLSGWLWRRSIWLGAALTMKGRRAWPLIVPAPIVATLAGVCGAAAYAALAGFNVPAQRALAMLAVSGVAFALGRSVAPSLALAWAGTLVLIVDPWAVVTAGFWLSFGAVALILFALHARLRVRAPERVESADDTADADRPRAQQRMRPDWRTAMRGRMAAAREHVASALRAQYAVTIGLAPLTAWWFSQVSIAGPIANAVAIPWVSALVVPAVLVGIVLPAPLDALAWQSAHALLVPLMRMLAALASQPWAEWHLPRPSVWAWLSAYAGILWCLMPRGWPLRFCAPLAWLPLAWPPPASIAHGAFRLTALDIGQGSAIVVETARHALLFDAGPGPESTHAGERLVVPYLRANGVPTLDALVISHADADHAGGAPAVLDALGVGGVRQLLGGLPSANALWDTARAVQAETVRCAAGQRWQWDGVEFVVLWPDAGPLPTKSNAQSCVLKVTAPSFSALLTGDIDAAIERLLRTRAPQALAADVLLVAHHGSKTSSTELFLDSVDPRVAVFQLGYRNRFRHPHPSVWSRFAARGIELARTDLDGAARIELDAGVLTLERYRDTHRRYWMDG
ncbi:DNA internalization-related competence protein ComEC/Rec2 [Trinickia fusca]|uniref:DNA internalization-related competence protein ComEC/Rec2 n=1 Tax=Trinickia fusca TaxID=2419777 RepID=A0A494XQM9_9BURK|nr:DNA internalization-related competence protein ComEC/Rec2 [Trinickia fusca]RKP50434.1 DNA internalization-related competence protein ComEC/Rec2 [Trinickia fusca]